MVDWRAHFDTIYSTAGIGVTATLMPAITNATYEITAIDKTGGINVGDDVTVASVKPAAVVRMYELAGLGLTRGDLGGASIEINGQSWVIQSTLPRPSPHGEADGELWLILSE